MAATAPIYATVDGHDGRIFQQGGLVLPRVLLIVALAMLAGMLLRNLTATGNRDTFRPRKRYRPGNATDATTFIISRAELSGLRDSFSAEPIDPDRALKRCPECQAVYHADSVVTLQRENRGKCISCNSRIFDDVQVV